MDSKFKIRLEKYFSVNLIYVIYISENEVLTFHRKASELVADIDTHIGIDPLPILFVFTHFKYWSGNYSEEIL